jgi:Xaa-Pro aminopeptidase
MSMPTQTHGVMGVDWEERVNWDRLRNARLNRIKSMLAESEAGALLCFDMTNVRYITATHIGTWAMDKMSRFTLLPQNAEPVLWDFGSAARHHQLYAPWIQDGNSRPDPTLLRGAIAPETGRAAAVAKKIYDELVEHGVQNDPLAIDIVELPILFELQKLGVTIIDGQQLMQNARLVKSEDEITLLSTAAAMVDAVYDELYRAMKPGFRESDAVALVSKRLYEMGSEYVEGVNAISGERCSPHPHVFSDRMLRPGDPAYFDILHSYMGYRTCYYRTFVVGSASQAQVDAYKKCRDILDHAISLVKPGVTTADVVGEAFPKAEEFGFPNEEAAFALQYGHGLGMAIWEKPVFSRMVSFDHPEEIKEGMVFALETFWPASDGWSAARIEEELVVTADGCEVISRFPAEELMVTGPKYHTATGPLSGVRDTESQWNNPRINPQGRPAMPVGDAIAANGSGS